MENLTFFVNFRLDQIQNCSIQIKKMKEKNTSKRAGEHTSKQVNFFPQTDTFHSFS